MDESLISHFEELRSRLIRIVIVVLGLSCVSVFHEVLQQETGT